MTVLVILIIVAVAVLVAMKTGKVKDANNNNIPDAIETPIKAAVEEVKEIVAKVEEVKAEKKAATKKSAAKSNAPKKTTKK
jgi:outer membrane murein-binding lipoprotein Lpp